MAQWVRVRTNVSQITSMYIKKSCVVAVPIKEALYEGVIRGLVVTSFTPDSLTYPVSKE